MHRFIGITIGIVLGLFVGYLVVGSSANVEAITALAPDAIKARGWTVLHCDGWQRGRFDTHGGTVHYMVFETNSPTLRYKVEVSMWDGKLQWYYNNPILLSYRQEKDLLRSSGGQNERSKGE